MLEKLYGRSSKIVKAKGVEELVRVYEDLERTLKGICDVSVGGTADSNYPIDVTKLIDQLSRSKKRLERKIGNKILLRRQSLRRRIRRFADAI